MSKPSANAYMFVIDGNGKQYDAFFDIVTIAGDYYGEVRYRPIGSIPTAPWVYLSSVRSPGADNEFDRSNMKTKEATDAEIDTVLQAINGGLKKVFGGDTTAQPEKGIERALWLLKNNGITEKDNVLTRT